MSADSPSHPEQLLDNHHMFIYFWSNFAWNCPRSTQEKKTISVATNARRNDVTIVDGYKIEIRLRAGLLRNKRNRKKK